MGCMFCLTTENDSKQSLIVVNLSRMSYTLYRWYHLAQDRLKIYLIAILLIGLWVMHSLVIIRERKREGWEYEFGCRGVKRRDRRESLV